MKLKELAHKHGTDKLSHGYITYYDKYFSPLDIKNLLEIGVREGWSLKMWAEYLPSSNVYGIDNFIDIAVRNVDKEKLISSLETDKIKICVGDQTDEKFLSEFKDKKLDVIIDDGSHRMHHQQLSFINLFPMLNSGGVYVIEDLHTCNNQNYWDPNNKDEKWTTLNFLNRLKKGEFDSPHLKDETRINKIIKDISNIEICLNKIAFISKN